MGMGFPNTYPKPPDPPRPPGPTFWQKSKTVVKGALAWATQKLVERRRRKSHPPTEETDRLTILLYREIRDQSRRTGDVRAELKLLRDEFSTFRYQATEQLDRFIRVEVDFSSSINRLTEALNKNPAPKMRAPKKRTKRK